MIEVIIECRRQYGKRADLKTGVAKKQNAKFSGKTKISYTCVSGAKKCSFFKKFGVLCFLLTPVLRIGLLPYYRRYSTTFMTKITHSVVTISPNHQFESYA